MVASFVNEERIKKLQPVKSVFFVSAFGCGIDGAGNYIDN